MLQVSKRKSHLLKRLWQESQTRFLAKAQAISAAGLLTISQMNGLFNDPTVKEYLADLQTPLWFPIFLLVIAGITYLAHGHEDDD